MSGMDYSKFQEFADNYKELSKDLDKFTDDFLMKQGMWCVGQAKRLTPVDTGRLRNGWKVSGVFKRKGEKYVVIHNQVNYASFVEDGHRITNNSGKTTINVGRGKHKRLRVINLGDTIKGTRWQKGHHMGRIALVKTQNVLPQRFSTEFAKFCKEKGIG